MSTRQDRARRRRETWVFEASRGTRPGLPDQPQTVAERIRLVETLSREGAELELLKTATEDSSD